MELSQINCDYMYDLIKHYNSNKKEINKTIEKILSKGVLEMGDEVYKFEDNFKKYCGAKYCLTVSSGSMGLLLALRALDIKVNDQVITVANSDIPTSHAITLVGADIKWIDVNEKTFNLNENLLEKNISKKTKVILPVHLFGNPANIKKIKLSSQKYNLKIVEDACLATGAEFENKKIGSFADITVFSTNPGKILDGIGPGGIVTTNNKVLFETLKKLRDYGRSSRPSKWPVKSELVGYNAKMSTINAAVLDLRLKYLEEYIEKRIAITPDILKKYSSHGFEICLSENYGTHIGIDDKQYLDLGAKIFKDDREILESSDLILQLGNELEIRKNFFFYP